MTSSTLRETIARIIEPHLWRMYDAGQLNGRGHEMCEQSLAKADSILALLPPDREEETTEMLSEIRGLVFSTTEGVSAAPVKDMGGDQGPTAAAYAAYGAWFDAVSALLDGETDEIDATTWTEWYAKDMPPESAAARYRRFHSGDLAPAMVRLARCAEEASGGNAHEGLAAAYGNYPYPSRTFAADVGAVLGALSNSPQTTGDKP